MGGYGFQIGSIMCDLATDDHKVYFTTESDYTLDCFLTLKQDEKSESFEEYIRYPMDSLLGDLFTEIEMNLEKEEKERKTQEYLEKTQENLQKTQKNVEESLFKELVQYKADTQSRISLLREIIKYYNEKGQQSKSTKRKGVFLQTNQLLIEYKQLLEKVNNDG